MLKLTGAALVVFASFLYGVILACRKKRRVEYLENTAVRLEKFKSLITLSKIPVTEALNMAAIDPNDAPEGADREKMEPFHFVAGLGNGGRDRECDGHIFK